MTYHGAGVLGRCGAWGPIHAKKGGCVFPPFSRTSRIHDTEALPRTLVYVEGVYRVFTEVFVGFLQGVYRVFEGCVEGV